jgi:pilus assembly protein Flp/PilA
MTLALERFGQVRPDHFIGTARLGNVCSPFYKETPMSKAKNLLVKLVKDEQGGEVLEYALIAGLIVVAAIAVIGAVGGKVLARWTSLSSSM